MDMPIPTAKILHRRQSIVAGLLRILPEDAVISDPTETRASVSYTHLLLACERA